MAVLVHDHVHAQLVAERLHHAGVLAHAALEHHGRGDLLAFAHVVQVVRGHRAAQAGDDVLARVAHLDLMYEVALGEHGATRRDVRGLLRGQRDVAELFHLHAQPMRLARQECARARRAQRVHGVVHGDAALHADDFRVLAADLQDGAHVGMQKRRAHRVRRDLVLHHGGAAHGAHQPPRAAGGAHGAHAHRVAIHLRAQVGHHAARGIGRVALGPQVRARDDAPVGVDDHALRGNRPDVDAEVAVRSP